MWTEKLKRGDWTLFLDRDGTINKRVVNGYVLDWDQFEFLENAIEGISELSKLFNRVIIVTNQQCIGKGLLSHNKLADIHRQMIERIQAGGGYIDQIYYCPNLVEEDALCRKPSPGMALQAQNDFDGIDFKKSVMVGDSISDMQFAEILGMKKVFVLNKHDYYAEANLHISHLMELVTYLDV